MGYVLAVACLILFLVSVGFDKASSNGVSGILICTIKAMLCALFLLIFIAASGDFQYLFKFENRIDILYVLFFGFFQGMSWFLYFAAVKRSAIDQFASFNELNFLMFANIWTLIYAFNSSINGSSFFSYLTYILGLLVLFLGSMLVVFSKSFDRKQALKWIFFCYGSCILGSFYTVVSPIRVHSIKPDVLCFYLLLITSIIGLIISFATKEYKKVGELKKENLMFLGIAAVCNSSELVLRFYANTADGVNLAIVNAIVSSYFVFLTLANAIMGHKKFPKIVWVAFVLMILGMILGSVAKYV